MSLAGCDLFAPPVQRAEGAVALIEVHKASRQMHLVTPEGKPLRRYRVALGNPEGHKVQRGDRRTPEGLYRIDRRNPKSAYHLALGLSYPSVDDIRRARAEGRDPGDNIFIHGAPNGHPRPPGDWTNGCIAVDNAEMEEIWALVPLGCPVRILA